MKRFLKYAVFPCVFIIVGTLILRHSSPELFSSIVQIQQVTVREGSRVTGALKQFGKSSKPLNGNERVQQVAVWEGSKVAGGLKQFGKSSKPLNGNERVQQVAVWESLKVAGGLKQFGKGSNSTKQWNAKEKVKASSMKKAVMKLEHYPFFYSPYPPAKVGDYMCSDSMCSEFLGEQDKLAFKFCTMRTVKKYNLSLVNPKKEFEGHCRFMDGSHRAAVALVSMPGAGNTWVRGLLQKATGICTGAIYCDHGLRIAGFSGEKIISGAVIVVKTHKRHDVLWTKMDQPRQEIDSETDNPYYGSGILLIRNPFDAMVADYQRFTTRKASKTVQLVDGAHHTDTLDASYFRTNEMWDKYVRARAPIFRLYFINWVISAKVGNHPLHVVRYESLKNDTYGEVRKMLDFLKVEYDPQQLAQRLAKDYDAFKRAGHADFDHYTASQWTLVKGIISETLNYLQAENNGITYGVESYLKT